VSPIAAAKKDRAQALAETLRRCAEAKAEAETALHGEWGVEVRSTFHDAVAELAELVASLDFRQMS
jgi:hypothetical protein